IAPDFVDDPGYLVDHAAIGGAPGTPLLAIDRAEIAVPVGPLVPDAHTVLFQVGDVGVAAQEPDQLVHDRFQMQLLGGDQRKTLREIEAHLPAEHAARAGAGAVSLDGTVLQHFTQQIEVRTHGYFLAEPGRPSSDAGNAIVYRRKVGARRDIAISATPITISGSDCICPIVTHEVPNR